MGEGIAFLNVCPILFGCNMAQEMTADDYGCAYGGNMCPAPLFWQLLLLQACRLLAGLKSGPQGFGIRDSWRNGHGGFNSIEIRAYRLHLADCVLCANFNIINLLYGKY